MLTQLSLLMNHTSCLVLHLLNLEMRIEPPKWSKNIIKHSLLSIPSYRNNRNGCDQTVVLEVLYTIFNTCNAATREILFDFVDKKLETGPKLCHNFERLCKTARTTIFLRPFVKHSMIFPMPEMCRLTFKHSWSFLQGQMGIYRKISGEIGIVKSDRNPKCVVTQ
jgi:hypothetical protein